MLRNTIRKTLQFSQRIFLGYETRVLTFSQAGEDLVIRNFFYQQIARGVEGFFLDVGAFHPYLHSNTYYLYRCGWRGINIDAHPDSKALFDKVRPGDTNIHAAIADHEGYIDLHCFDGRPNLSTVSVDFADRLGNSNAISGSVSVPCMSLASILEEKLPSGRDIDFFSIDIEGGEAAALASNNWEKFRAKLIAIEIPGRSLADIAHYPTASFLLGHGYDLFARVILPTPDLSTVFFVDKSQ
ncbi:MAG: FkbM family methyltransferase [Acidobacteria bacterium]|nr:FkbM family methyltransferase [Acidobacteriota bacterium]